MDAREAEAWLSARLPTEDMLELDKAGITTIPRRSMTDVEWRKAKSLSYCNLGKNNFAKRFVADMVALPYDAPITERQGRYIEVLWQRYRRQHCFNLSRPRWYYNERAVARTYNELYEQSEIGLLQYYPNAELSWEIEPDAASYAKDGVTIVSIVLPKIPNWVKVFK
jgi:hypothetical protein